MAGGDLVSLKLDLRENFYRKTADPVELGLMVFKTGTTFQELNEAVGTEKVVFLMATLITNFCSQFNLGPGKNMNQGQIVQLAIDLATSFIDRKGNAVRFEEMVIFFDKAGKNEYLRPAGKPFVFDRIDRSVIEEIMDYYFENDRTRTVWAIEDEKNNRKREHLADDLPRLSNEVPATVGDIYTRLAGKPGAITLAKMAEKYGDNPQTGQQ